MRDFFHSGRFKVLLCIFALLLGILIYAAVSGGAASVPEAVINTITRPFVSAATSISSWVEETIDKVVNADKYKTENDRLKQQLTELYAQIIDKDKTDKENEELRKMLELSEENDDFKWAPPANIIARDAVDIYGGFTINRGSDDGIKLGDPVFNEIGLIGVISEIAPNYAKVTTILSTEVHIGVKVVSSGAVGMIENDIIYSADGKCQMSYVERDSKIKAGDVIVTAGGKSYPENLIIGIVESVFIDDNGLSLHAVITPSVDVFRITSVFVITSFKGQGG